MISVSQLDSLRERYIVERPQYVELAERVSSMLKAETRRRGLACTIESRAKDVPSFVKKALRKPYTSPWEEIRDKAGVRVVTVYQETIAQAEAVVRELFEVHHYDDKRLALEPDKLDYLGVHFEVTIPRWRLNGGCEGLEDLVCEIQLHTRAQNLWATVSHELVYKTGQLPPVDVKRSIYRLMALLELFDEEVARGWERVMAQPGFQEARILADLEFHFCSLTARSWDPQLSRRIVEILRPLLSEAEIGEFRARLDTFVERNRSKLEAIFADYREDDRNPLVSQPESLLVFERLEHDRFQLTELWVQHLPDSLLRSFSDIWGIPVDV
jgi:ppGpp synthetase/RelA/SpoT-type nucleotidyltranferase